MRYLNIMLLGCALTLAFAVGFAFANRRPPSSAPTHTIYLPPGQGSGGAQSAAPLAAADYVQSSGLGSRLREALKAYGDRLERPGKERLTITGMLLRADAQPVPLALISEFPGRLRTAWHDGAGAHTLVFNERAAGNAPSLDQFEQALLETLAYDTAEHFFAGQMRGTAMRPLGSRFRPHDAPVGYAGPYYDVYQTTETLPTRDASQQQGKFYYFNSDTLLLELVRYEVVRAGSVVPVEVRFREWRAVQGQQVPGRVERVEGGQVVLTLTLDNAAIAPRLEDGSFGPLE